MNYPDILGIAAEPDEFAWDDRYTMLYALGVGCGSESGDLDFVYEKRLAAIPTMAVTLQGGTGEIITKADVDFRRMVHGEQRLTLYRPIPATGRVSSRSRCLDVVDKGRDKGALLVIESTICDAASNERLAVAVATLFCRGDGGFGGPRDGGLPPHPTPRRGPDLEIALPTLSQQAAIYRLLGDRTPFHIDPDSARAAGFDRPILHGLCTYGIACRAVMRACCDNDPTRIERFDARFSAPVYPGDTVVTRVWREGQDVAFECIDKERGATTLRNGFCKLRGA